MAQSVGDVMRDLDAKAFLSGDFLVVYGDVVSNYPLESAIAKHKERRKKNKNSAMTMLLRDIGTGHRHSAHDVSPVFLIDPRQDRCLYYQQLSPTSSHQRLNFDPQILQDYAEIEIRRDLVDCGIDICTPEILSAWGENFDYQAPRRDFLHRVLTDDIFPHHIHTHVIEDHYAARVKDIASYGTVSSNILGRWAYPLCPDSNLVRGQTYQRQYDNCYRECDVSMANSSNLQNQSMIGSGSSVGQDALITRSVIGRHCHIGKNVTIRNSYIWDGSTIGDNTTIESSIIAQNVRIGKECQVRHDSLVAQGVCLADCVRLASMSRIIGELPSEPNMANQGDSDLVGPGGIGHAYADSDDEGRADSSKLTYNNTLRRSDSQESISTLQSDMSSTDLSARQQKTRSTSFGSFVSDENNSVGGPNPEFHQLASTDIFDSLQRGVDQDNISLELQALRLSNNATDQQIQRAVIVALVKRLSTFIDAGNDAKFAVIKTLTKDVQHGLIRPRFRFDTETNKLSDQVDFLNTMQTELGSRVKGQELMLHSCNALYVDDTIESDGFERWWAVDLQSKDVAINTVKQAVKPLMDAMEEDDETDSSDDDDEEDD